MIKIDSKAAAKRVEDAPMIDVFEIDGTTYSIPEVTRADVSLDYIARVRDEGDDVATAHLIIEMMGEDAFQALRNVKGLEPADWLAIRDRVQEIVTPKAPTNRATRRA